VIRRDGETQCLESERVDPYRLQLDDFAAAIAGERAPRLGREDATAQAAAIEALYASAARYSPVTLGEDRGGAAG
jgi:predicted dehydrogenase